MNLHEKIVKMRKERGWTQPELSKRVGFHAAHISRIENGKSQPSIDLLNKLAKVFGVTMDYLVNNGNGETTSVSIKNKSLMEKIELIDKLNDKDQEIIIGVIESMLTKQKLKDFLQKELSD